MKYCFYIDKQTNNKNDKYIDVKLERPIIAYNNEYLSIKVKDLQYLNNIYNISAFLQNNIINLVRQSLTYDVVNLTYRDPAQIAFFEVEATTSILYITNPSINPPPYFRDDTIATYDMENSIYTIENDEYSISYYTPTLIENEDPFGVFNQDGEYVDINIPFNGFSSTGLDIQDDRYIEMGIKSAINPSGLVVNQVNFKLIYDGGYNPNTFDITFNLVLYGSQDRINYTTLNYTTTGASNIRIQSPAPAGRYDKIGIVIDNAIPYKYYRARVFHNQGENSPVPQFFKLYATELFKQNYTLGSTISQPTTTNITIPDGFYKATNYISTINSLLESYNITTELNTITNKISITNNNTAPSPVYLAVDEFYNTTLQLPTKYIQHNLGFNQELNTLQKGNTIFSDTNIDLINFKKVILTTNLDFENKTHNELTGANTDETGIGNILVWLDADEPPLTCIKYKNIENTTYKLQNKEIHNLIFYLYNEKKQLINLDNMLINFEIEKRTYRYS